MIEVTKGAANLLTEVRTTNNIPETYGLRFYNSVADDGSAAVAIAFAQAPAQGDEVLTEKQMPVYVASDVVQEMSGATLDVEGDGGSQRFVILAGSG
ncbi:MAG TPA: hypothetical protein VGS62_04700 [Streptosporangiaceae bacterium]|nr:hypothetical protein [Streptosporangiaceae bacterium]